MPIAKPAAAQMNSTLGFSTTSVAAVTAARAGVTLVSERIHPGVWADRWRVNQRNIPNTINAAPTTMRSHAAHFGALSRPPSRSATSTKTAVSANSPTSQPARKARPVGLGRGVCSTRTAGMMDSGDSATTSASGMSSISTDPQLPDIQPPFRRIIRQRT